MANSKASSTSSAGAPGCAVPDSAEIDSHAVSPVSAAADAMKSSAPPPALATDRLCDCAGVCSVAANETQALGKAIIVGRDQSTVAGATQILAWKKRVASNGTYATNNLTLITGTDRLAGILDYRRTDSLRELSQRRKVGAQPE